MPIKNKEQAHRTWVEFHKRHENLYKEENLPARYNAKLTVEQQSEYLKKLEEKGHTKASLNKSAKVIQNFWSDLRKKDRLINVNRRGYHTKNFAYFLNAQKAKKSINKNKLDKLLQCVNDGIWQDAIFRDETIANLTLSLYAANKISYEQTCSILEYVQIEEAKTARFFPIFDKEGGFTKEAELMLIPMLQKHPTLKSMSSLQINELKLLISSLPQSEQVFYVTQTPKRSELGQEFLEAGIILEISKPILGLTGDLHLTMGLRDAVGLARFGIDEYVPIMPRLGRLTTSDIERGVRQKVREAAVYFPGIPKHPRIHNIKNYSHSESTEHDYSHSVIMSTLPKKLLAALHDMIDISRSVIGKDMPTKSNGDLLSKEIWAWIDMSFTFSYQMHQDLDQDFTDPKLLTELFCNILQAGSTEDIINSVGGYLIYLHPENPTFGKLSILGVAVMLDMISQPEKWKEKGIIPDHFIGPYKIAFEELKLISSLTVNNPPKLQILKVQLFQPILNIIIESGTMHIAETFFSSISLLNEILNFNAIFIEQKLKFKKTSQNHIVFEYDNQAITQDTIGQIIKDILSKRNPTASTSLIDKWAQIICEADSSNNEYETCLSLLIEQEIQPRVEK